MLQILSHNAILEFSIHTTQNAFGSTYNAQDSVHHATCYKTEVKDKIQIQHTMPLFNKSEKTATTHMHTNTPLLQMRGAAEGSLVCFFHHSNLAITGDTSSTFAG